MLGETQLGDTYQLSLDAALAMNELLSYSSPTLRNFSKKPKSMALNRSLPTP